MHYCEHDNFRNTIFDGGFDDFEVGFDVGSDGFDLGKEGKKWLGVIRDDINYFT